jgi:uncharacterized protein (TIGR03032 family)
LDNTLAALRPLFVVGAPRSGIGLVGEVLDDARGVFSADTAAPNLVDRIPGLSPSERGWRSSRLTDADASVGRAEHLADAMLGRVRDRADRRPDPDGVVHVVDASALHNLRVPFLAALLERARFVYVHREPGPAIASSIEAWASGRFSVYEPVGWVGTPWAFSLMDRWEELVGRPVAEVAARQWIACTELLVSDLGALSQDRWTTVSFEEFVADPTGQVERLCHWWGPTWDGPDLDPLPLSVSTVTPPDVAKESGSAVDPEILGRARMVADDAVRALAVRTAPAGGPTPAALSRLDRRERDSSSWATSSLLELLWAEGSSLIVSTYHSGRLLMVGTDGSSVRMKQAAMPKPMGVAVGPQRITVGTRTEVITFAEHPGARPVMDPMNELDGCFLPLSRRITGDIKLHDLVAGQGGLWGVSTAYSCVVTFDGTHSFVPRLRPPFVGAFSALDVCHLNGLCLVQGRPKFVTALGESDEPSGWRDGKGQGGIVIDLDSNETITRGLCMPHSPRWYRGRLWLLESGAGRLVTVDPASGHRETVAEVPGFARGLAFMGDHALIGLSQARETIFRGLPILERPNLQTGVWVVDLRTGVTTGHIQFDHSIRELYDVQVLPGYRQAGIELDSPLSAGAVLIPANAVTIGEPRAT